MTKILNLALISSINQHITNNLATM